MIEDKIEEKASVVRSVTDRMRQGEIDEDMCMAIDRYTLEFERVGVSRIGIMAILDLKAKLAFCPDPLSYSIQNSQRVNYIYKNLDNPDIALSSGNEKRFASALSQYYSLRTEYNLRLKELIQGIGDNYDQGADRVRASITRDDTADFLGGILFNRGLPALKGSNLTLLGAMFDKYDLHDVYNMPDNSLLLKWKAARAAESEKLLDEGLAEVLFIDAGINTDELESRITRYKIDKQRISKAELFTPYIGASTFIRCRVDGKDQKEKKMSRADVAGQNSFVNITGLAVKYFQNVLDRNRESGKAIANENTLIRTNMDYTERMVDIYRNGLSQEDVMLLKISKDANVDKLWHIHKVQGMEDESVEVQKSWAFGELVHHLDGLRPGMLSDDEIVQLTTISNEELPSKRKGEVALMNLPEFYFSMIEQSGEHQQGVIDYVKVLRDIGRITPNEAYHSMYYYLENRLETKWDAAGAFDEYGNAVGCDYYPNEDMKNPAMLFPPNLLSEQQWHRLCEKYEGKADCFVPHGAFREDRVTDIQVYPDRGGGMMIRCLVDGVQQGARNLPDEMVRSLEENEKKELVAVACFSDVFDEGINSKFMIRR